MVGLPARGKSYLSNKLQRYLLVRVGVQRLSRAYLTVLGLPPAVAGIRGMLVPRAPICQDYLLMSVL